MIDEEENLGEAEQPQVRWAGGKNHADGGDGTRQMLHSRSQWRRLRRLRLREWKDTCYGLDLIYELQKLIR